MAIAEWVLTKEGRDSEKSQWGRASRPRLPRGYGWGSRELGLVASLEREAGPLGKAAASWASQPAFVRQALVLSCREAARGKATTSWASRLAWQQGGPS